MKKLYLILLLLFLGVHPAMAQLEALGFHFKSEKRKRMTVEFEQYNNLIVIPVQVNGLDTLNFVLDTGVGYTLITDPLIMESLNLKCHRQVKVAGSGVGRELMGCITNIDNIQFKGIEANHHNVIVLEEDVLHLSQYAGVKIHGLIGYDLFSRFAIKINYPSRVLTFYEPTKFNYRGKGEKFPISIEAMKPYIFAEATLSAGSTPVKLILDTGAGHSLSLDQGAHPNIQLPKRSLPSQLGMTLNGAVRGAVGRIHKFKLGSFELEKVITSFPDSNSLKFIRNIAERQGNIGCGVLKRFHLLFNYPNNELVLKPNKNFNEPFEFNTTGVDLIAEGPRYDVYKVGNIRKNSPADEAGLKRGDQVIAADEHTAHDLSLNELYKVLNKKEGKITSLFIRRGGQFKIIDILCRQPI